MTGYQSKKAAAQAKTMDDDDIQSYQRPWVGLTDEDIWALHDGYLNPVEFARAVEAKLKKRNAQE